MARHEDLVGETIGARVRLVRSLGHGGMGAVYEGVQLATGCRVAVKVLHPFLAMDTEHFARFRREAQTAMSLGHPNIVRVVDFDLLGGDLAFIVMDLVEGRSLHTVIHQEAPLEPSRLLRFGLQILSALDAVHRVGVVHRDLKPGNILVTHGPGGDEIAMLLDFGIAKMMEGKGYTRLTQTGVVLGTPSYMAPEQATGRGIDGRADLYALGVVMFAALTGRLPFQGHSPGELLHKILVEPPPPLRSLAPGVDPLLEKLVEHALQKDPARRFASAADMASACNAVLVHLVPHGSGLITHFQPTVPVAALVPIPPSAPAPTPQEPPASVPIATPNSFAAKPRQSAWLPFVIAGILGLAGLGAAATAALLWVQKRTAPVPVPEAVPASAPEPEPAAVPVPESASPPASATGPRGPRVRQSFHVEAQHEDPAPAATPDPSPRPAEPPPAPSSRRHVEYELRYVNHYLHGQEGELRNLVALALPAIEMCYHTNIARAREDSWYEEWMIDVNADGSINNVNVGGSVGPGGHQCPEHVWRRQRWPIHPFAGSARATIQLRWRIVGG